MAFGKTNFSIEEMCGCYHRFIFCLFVFFIMNKRLWIYDPRSSLCLFISLFHPFGSILSCLQNVQFLGSVVKLNKHCFGVTCNLIFVLVFTNIRFTSRGDLIFAVVVVVVVIDSSIDILIFCVS
jgi:hypothetical protein